MPRNAATPSAWRQPSWIIVLVAGGLVIFFLTGIARETMRWYSVRQQVTRLQRDVRAEQQHQKQLEDLLAYLHSPTFQEREARLKLGLKKEGERVIIVTPDASSSVVSDPSQSGSSADQPPDSIPQRWWRYFFHSSRLAS